MPTLKLDLLVINTYTTMTMGVLDSTIYPDENPIVSSPTLSVSVPGFDIVEIPFDIQELNLLNSTDLGITTEGNEEALPDGIYYLTYTIEPADENFVERTIVRVDNLQEKFDNAFLTLDLMECDRAIKTQAMVQLNSIYLFIQGAIAAANNCAADQAMKLYNQADRMLDHFLSNNCGCSNNNFTLH